MRKVERVRTPRPPVVAPLKFEYVNWLSIINQRSPPRLNPPEKLCPKSWRGPSKKWGVRTPPHTPVVAHLRISRNQKVLKSMKSLQSGQKDKKYKILNVSLIIFTHYDGFPSWGCLLNTSIKFIILHIVKWNREMASVHFELKATYLLRPMFSLCIILINSWFSIYHIFSQMACVTFTFQTLETQASNSFGKIQRILTPYCQQW